MQDRRVCEAVLVSASGTDLWGLKLCIFVFKTHKSEKNNDFSKTFSPTSPPTQSC
jgi:hypothetical protein